MLHVGGVLGQLTVTVDCVLGSVHIAVLGNWIESALCPDDGSCTGKVAPPPATVAVASRVLPLLNSCTIVPAGAFVVICTLYWKPSVQFMLVSFATVSADPVVGAVNATV